ncbi:MAG TPA: glycosyltransferase family 4 protein [Solirubrobacteraceae bacterium]|nr:glycosyltransferase family 4 protein [Solirubrobacteraceae bacterium]
MSRPARPVLLVTNFAPPFRVGAFARLHEREDIVVALVGGGVRHGGGAGGPEPLPFPALRVPERAVGRLAASGRFRAVIAGLSGRVALPSAYAGARAARIPFVLWATIWRHPRTPAHALSYVPLRHLYRHADAIATYGPHVSAYVRSKGARGPVVEAPQSVDDAFWADAAQPHRIGGFQAMFAGRDAPEKGLGVLLRAWEAAGLGDGAAALVLAGGGSFAAPRGVHAIGALEPSAMRNFYAGSDVVVVPSVPTRDFLEPWGLVVNEAFDQGVPVIATTAVGAAAGGLVRHEQTGLVVAPGDVAGLAAALRRLHDDPALRTRLGAAARDAVRAFSHDAWAAGMARALAAAGVSRGGRGKSHC